MDLAHALELFNRKERNLLIREALGDQVERLKLSAPFRDRVANALQIDCIPSNAWWATDYHLEWLAGALAVYTEGTKEAVTKGARPNPKEAAGGTLHCLVKGNQEDIDLIIASGTDLILIEAKGDSAWSNRQLASKLPRLRLLHSDYHSSLINADPQNIVQFHLLLMSPYRPEKLNKMDWLDRERTEPPWIRLPWPSETLKVGRCDRTGRPFAAREPDYWCIIENSSKVSTITAEETGTPAPCVARHPVNDA